MPPIKNNNNNNDNNNDIITEKGDKISEKINFYFSLKEWKDIQGEKTLKKIIKWVRILPILFNDEEKKNSIIKFIEVEERNANFNYEKIFLEGGLLNFFLNQIKEEKEKVIKNTMLKLILSFLVNYNNYNKDEKAKKEINDAINEALVEADKKNNIEYNKIIEDILDSTNFENYNRERQIKENQVFGYEEMDIERKQNSGIKSKSISIYNEEEESSKKEEKGRKKEKKEEENEDDKNKNKEKKKKNKKEKKSNESEEKEKKSNESEEYKKEEESDDVESNESVIKEEEENDDGDDDDEINEEGKNEHYEKKKDDNEEKNEGDK